MQSLQFIGIHPDQFKEELIKAIHEVLDTKIEYSEPPPKIELVTRKEAAEILDISLPTLHRWTKSGNLVSYGKGSRVYYKRHEIENSLVTLNT